MHTINIVEAIIRHQKLRQTTCPKMGAHARHVQVNSELSRVIFAINRKECFMEKRHKKNILRLKTLKKNIETHQNFTVFLKKGVEVLHEIQTP